MNKSMVTVLVAILMVTVTFTAINSSVDDVYGTTEPLEGSLDVSNRTNKETHTYAGRSWVVIKEATEEQYVRDTLGWGCLIIDTDVVERRAFAGKSIDYILLTENVERIEAYAFQNCTNLKGIEKIGNGQVSMEENAFYGCTSLKMIDLRTYGSVDPDAVPSGCTAFVVVRDGENPPNIDRGQLVHVDDPTGTMYLIRVTSSGDIEVLYLGDGLVQFTDHNGDRGTWTRSAMGSGYLYSHTPRANSDVYIGNLQVEIDYNGAFGLNDCILEMTDGINQLEVPDTTVTGASFPGWKDKNTGTVYGTSLSAETINANGAYILDLVMNGDSFQIDFNTDGIPASENAETVSSQTYYSGMNYPTIPDTARYTMKGWIMEGDVNCTVYEMGTPVTTYGTQTLNAVWEPKTTAIWNVCYVDFAGVEIGTATQVGHNGTFTVGDLIPDDMPVDTIFTGWSHDGNRYVANDEITVTTDIVLTPENRPANGYTVTYIDGGRIIHTEDVIEARTYTVTIDDLRSDGDYVFNGWNLDDTKPGIHKNDTFIITGDHTLTAEFRTKSVFTLTFYNDSVEFKKGVVKEGESFLINFDDPEADGKVFQNWNVRGTDTTYGFGDTILPTSDIELDAIWESLPRYIISFKDGDDPIHQTTVGVGEGYSIDIQDPSNDAERIFLGWNIDGTTGTYRYNDPVTIGGDTEFIATWKIRETYELKFMIDDTLFMMDSVREGFDYTIDFEGPEDTDEAFFIGWNVYNQTKCTGDSFHTSGDMDIESVWKDREVYTVSFIDGTKKLHSVVAIEGLEFKVDVPDPSDDQERIFLGWSLDGSPKLLQLGSTIEITKDTSIDSEWRSREVYEVIYKDDGKIISTDTSTEGFSFTIDQNDPDDTSESIFVGWSVGNKTYCKGDSIDITDDTEIIAEWMDRQTFTVTYLVDGKVHHMDTCKEGYDHIVFPNGPEDTPDKVFLGWTIDGDVLITGEIVIDEDTEISAKWRDREVYTISFIDGSTTLFTRKVTEGSTFTMDADDRPDDDDRIFMGWIESETGISVNGGDKFTPKSDTIISSVWRDRYTYTVIFMTSEGEIHRDTAKEGMPFVISVDDPTTGGSGKFVGWSMDGQKKLLTNGSSVILEGDSAFVAIWDGMTSYKVTYISDDIILQETRVTGGTEIRVGTAVLKEGHTLSHWSDGYSQRSDGSSYVVSRDVTFTAVWMADECFTLTFHLKNGSTSIVVDAEAEYTISVNPGTKEGYDFIGWSVGGDGTSLFLNGMSYRIVADMDLHPVWVPLIDNDPSEGKDDSIEDPVDVGNGDDGGSDDGRGLDKTAAAVVITATAIGMVGVFAAVIRRS